MLNKSQNNLTSIKVIEPATSIQQTIKINNSNGISTFALNRKEVFKAGISSCFKEKEYNIVSCPTPETHCKVYKLTQYATVFEMFECINSDFSLISFTQAQIVEFCKSYLDRIDEAKLILGGTAFFLCKLNDYYFSVYISILGKGFLACYCPIGDKNPCDPHYLTHIIVPK